MQILGKTDSFLFCLLLCCLLLLSLQEVYSSQQLKYSKYLKKKLETVKEHFRQKDKYHSNFCTNSRKSSEKVEHLSRQPRAARRWRNGGPKSGNALYFSGKEILKLKTGRRSSHVDIPSHQFTVELWVKPEGGQFDPVTIIEMLDVCNEQPFQSIWTLGIKSHRIGDIPNPSYFFSLKTEQIPDHSVISAHYPYTHGKWTHIAVTYDLKYLKFYINNAMVAITKKQRGGLSGIVTRRCKELRLGGDVISGAIFRGTVEDLRLWNRALNHSEIYQIYNTQLNPDTGVVFYDSFENIKNWRKLTRHIPELVTSDITDGNENILVKTPQCGKTICDDPVLVKSYLSNSQLRTNKEIRYRVINLMNDDGTDPAVTSKQIRTQHRALVNAFSPYNISWELRQENVRRSELRQKSVLLICDPSNVGDTICQQECRHWQTGNDGGDCEPFIRCLSGNLGNGRCEFECNKEYHLWDGGDCCEPGSNTNLTCFDPTSSNRGYLGVGELKEAIALDSSTYLNIYVVPNSVDDLSALASLPWDKSALDTRGGIVIRSREFGSPHHSRDLVHEIGHVFGLYHVHHGVSEVECDDPCFESEASMTLGDLCSDTEPTPNNTYCRDPDEAKSHCGMSSFRNTPFNNYMSYAADDCLNNFTPQQVARMHCYLDLVYQGWSTSKKPAPVPLAPKAVMVDTNTVKLQWLPPLGPIHMATSSICSLCDDFFSVSQFATSSNSSHPGGRTYHYKPKEAEGPPDAEACKMSINTWIPDADDDDCEQTGCYLELGFQYPVIPSRLKIWLNTLGTIEDIELISVDGTSQYLGLFPTSCDKPLTIKLSVTKRVSHVRIYSLHPAIGVDAVELSTEDSYSDCLRCRSRKYKITRDPPFSTGSMKQTSEPVLIDSDVMGGMSYNYSIMVSIGQRESENSPVLHYTHGDPICGDGIINGEPLENCDDGNVADGDGCSRSCSYEENFRCRGEPSLCYIHDGDGICEEFETRISVKDCGFYTPDGFDDQWAESAVANPDFQDLTCPETNILGIPDPENICKTFVDPSVFWHPCRHSFQPGNFWIEVYFATVVIATEVIIHLGSVGEVLLGIEDPPFLRVELISVYNISTVLQPERVLISCKRNPVHVSVHHDLSKPFSLTRGVRIRFTSYQISIAGVCLRSSHWLDPVTVASCSSDQVYNPRSGLCVQQNCSMQFCGIVSIPHSHSNCSGYREGDVCRITCETGFELSDLHDRLVCIDGTWESRTSLECVPINCGTPKIPNASIACLNGTTFGNSCVFKCIRPSVLQGSDILITCQADGYWSTPSSFCQVKCRSPYSITNAKLATKSCKRGYHPVGKRCKYKCHRGYQVSNAKPTKKRLKIICGKDGNWRGGICTRVRCPSIDLEFTGLYTCTNIQYAGSTCTLRCREEQEVQRITCSALGKWSGTFRMCPSIGTSGNCLRLEDSDHLLFRCNGNNIGSQCTVSCLLPNSNPIMQSRTNTVRGQLVGQMEMDIPIRQLMCTALLEWQPNPDTLSCVKSCNQKYLSDGWCDADNNNARCEWDGGDCCASTSNTGLVHPFPETCVDGCRCRDPTAEENIRKQVRKVTTRRRKSRQRYKFKSVVSTSTVSSIESRELNDQR